MIWFGPASHFTAIFDGSSDERPSDIRACLRVRSRIGALRRLPPGMAVGVRTFKTPRRSIGVAPIGYGHGYSRHLSNIRHHGTRANAGQQRRLVPAVGQVSMDQTSIDMTEGGDV